MLVMTLSSSVVVVVDAHDDVVVVRRDARDGVVGEPRCFGHSPYGSFSKRMCHGRYTQKGMKHD